MPGPQAWSIDATLNDVIDPEIYLAEGQAPPTLNNASRAIMAGIARRVADTSGSLQAGGTANAVTVSTNQGFLEVDLTRQFELAFTATAENTGPVTFSPDGATAKPVLGCDGLPLAPGDLRPNLPYRVRRLPKFKDSYMLVEPALPPTGTLAEFGAEMAVPKGWVICDGRLLSRTDYAALFSAIGTTYGNGNGTTTFAAPDKRGRASFGADAMGGAPANRLTAAGGVTGTVGSAGGAEAVTLTGAQLPNVTPTGTVGDGGATAATLTGDGGAVAAATTGDGGAHTPAGTVGQGGAHTPAGTVAPGGVHGHVSRYTKITNVQSSGGLTLTATLYDGVNTPNSAGQTENSEAHGHGFTGAPVPPHDHPFSGTPVPNHNHTLPEVAPHKHPVPAVPAHGHPLTMNPLGSGTAHPNMPPAIVTVFAIKA